MQQVAILVGLGVALLAGFIVYQVLIALRDGAVGVGQAIKGLRGRITNSRKWRDEQRQAKIRATNPAELVGAPDEGAFNKAFADLDAYTLSANRYRPPFRFGYEAAFHDERFPTEAFSLARPDPDSLLGESPPEQVSITLGQTAIPLGLRAADLYDAANRSRPFAFATPAVWLEAPEPPKFPILNVPKPVRVQLLSTRDGSDIADAADSVRHAYRHDLHNVDALNGRWAELIEIGKRKYQQARQAYEAVEIHSGKLLAELQEQEAAIREEYAKTRLTYERARKDATSLLRRVGVSYRSCRGISTREHFIIALRMLTLPIPGHFEWSVFFDPASRTLQVNQRVPANADIIVTRADSKRAPAKREAEYVLRWFTPSLSLRIADQIAKNDMYDEVDIIAVNCWSRFFEPSTGRIRDAFVASLNVSKADILQVDITKADPVEAYRALKGAFVFSTEEIVPIEPSIRLDKEDERFVPGRDVLEGMAQGQNLATMDWQDFEHLIRELLAKEFGKNNSEVKITRASRDRGVDAVIFNPDPLHGGRIVVQAKRYSNLVDAAAVRELYGTVTSERANRGILVTTSWFGKDARDWASDKPLTLIDGQNLLALLNKHGYNFGITFE